MGNKPHPIHWVNSTQFILNQKLETETLIINLTQFILNLKIETETLNINLQFILNQKL